MAYRLKPDERPRAAIRRIVVEQADKALIELRRDAEPAACAHNARKRFKKIRAALRLVHGELSKKEFARLDAAWRDAGRFVAPLRDLGARLETIDMIRDKIDDPSAADALAGVRAALADRATHSAAEQMAALAHAAQAVEAARADAAKLDIESKGFGAFRAGLTRIYRQGGEFGAVAFATGAAEDFHDWRKRVKYLSLHARLLAPVAPEIMAEIGARTEDLAELLGQDHDISELRALIVLDFIRAGDNEITGAQPDLLAQLLAERSLLLRARARPMFEALYAERPKDFAARVEANWDGWRAAG